MKLFVVIALLVAVANAGFLRAPGIATIQELQSRGDTRIIGGSQASAGQFPYQAAVLIDSSYFCGGSLISTRWILTAAHCAYQRTNFGIGLGALTTGNWQFQTSTKVVHSGYNQNTLNNDIAVLNLPSDASGTNISPVSLSSSSIGGGVGVTISGWGKTSDSASGISSVLMYTNLNTITNTDCASYYGSIIVDSTLCTSVSGGSSTCNGDSGGPLVNSAKAQVGIVSFGSSAGCASAPNGFARISSFRSWITQNTGV